MLLDGDSYLVIVGREYLRRRDPAGEVYTTKYADGAQPFRNGHDAVAMANRIHAELRATVSVQLVTVRTMELPK